MMAARGRMRRGSAGSGCRSCATGLSVSTPKVLMVSDRQSAGRSQHPRRAPAPSLAAGRGRWADSRPAWRRPLAADRSGAVALRRVPGFDLQASQRKTSQRVSQSASPPSHTRLAKPSRSRRSSDGSHVTETDLISDICRLPQPSAGHGSVMETGATMFRCFCYIRSAQAIQSRDKDDLNKSTSRPPPQSCPMGIFCNAISEGFG